MSASGAGGPRVRELFERAANAGSLGGVIFQGMGAVLLAIGGALASGVLTIADVFIVPLQALIGGVSDVIGSFFGGAATIIDFGAIGTAISIGPGGMFNVGPLTFALAVGAILLAFWLMRAYVSEEPTSNVFPGLPFDVPTPGFLDAEEDDKD